MAFALQTVLRLERGRSSRTARPSSACVRRMASSRSLSHGFSMKSLRAAAHGLDRQAHRAPGRHHDDRQRVVGGADAAEQIEAFLAGCRVARVVQIDQDHVVLAAFERPQDARQGNPRCRSDSPRA